METALGGNNAGAGSSGGDAGAGGNGSGAGQGAGSPSSWRDSLPADLKDNAILSKYSDLPNAMKALIHSQEMIGKKGAIVPGEKATDEEWNSFYKAIGVPEADKYDVQLPKDAKIDPLLVNGYKEVAVKNGLLPKQAAAVLEWYNKTQADNLAKSIEAKKTAATEGLNNLKKEWGDAYDRELASAQLAVKEVGGDELVQYLNKTGLGNDINLIKTFSKVGKLLGEDKLREGGVLGTDAQTRAEIEAQIADIRANGDKNGFFDRNHPNHGPIMAKFESLAKKLTGGR